VVLNMVETGSLTLDELDEIRRKLKKRAKEDAK
jgi:hypothetical protein